MPMGRAVEAGKALEDIAAGSRREAEELAKRISNGAKPIDMPTSSISTPSMPPATRCPTTFSGPSDDEATWGMN